MGSRKGRVRTRGSATVELAVVLPALVALVLGSLFLTDLLIARLELRQRLRFAAWEMTFFSLSDFVGADHAAAFERARAAAHEEVRRQFGDGSGEGFVLAIEEEPVGLAERALPSGGEGEETFGDVPAVYAEGGAGLGALLDRWRLNPKGRVRVEGALRVTSPWLSAELFGTAWATRALRDRLTLVADGWWLSDGGAVRLDRRGAPRAETETVGQGLAEQVGRMKRTGLTSSISGGVALGVLLQKIPLQLRPPNPEGTFVVSHPYGLLRAGEPDTGCSPGHPARSGLNDLSVSSRIDDPPMRCFDTAPFRDRASYADSLYVQLHTARGPHFLGCRSAQAEDASGMASRTPGQNARCASP